ncbi:circumsporozoite protein-like [Toxorhynchites rutilus septentrionalis]|uniref:circumsporozoite protein-like n=1 Tax=Toxorhynchites rutilus septentrionalis TaxID=329112 RepID=UPI00247A8858|nr:circumsporozoite protein-like [Toxorhynchites rutilus septentrionalis]XP_055621251.1 circumsporozoite protein-like [Toxorhynchites rutilus septentrionalis]XP_055621252.1 circumsporozoite protein-like [Toxorhynchites rutilus septentrionalis]
MELSRIKLLCGALILQMLFSVAVPLPYTKYGRQCSDIGCLSNQVCVMAYDSCSLGQRDGNECGRYPTCKKNSEAGLAAGPSDNSNDLFSNKPAPPKSAPPSNDQDVLGSLGLNPDTPSYNRPADVRPQNPSAPAAPGYNPYSNPYPALPANTPKPAAPYYPSGGHGNNGNYGGGSYDGTSGGNRRPGQFDGAGGNIVIPTKKPTASSGGFFGGIFSGIQDALTNAVKQQAGTYINQRLGIGPAAGQAGGAGALGGLLDARNFIDTKKFGGLFSENKPATSGSVGSYPVTVDQRTQAHTAYAQPNRRVASEVQDQRQRAANTPAPYGWKLD